MSGEPQAPLPHVSVIMPVRNEEAFIARSLGAVLAQDYPPDRLEILVGDGMSDDRTVEVIQSLPGGERIQIIPNPERIQSFGLNRLLDVAGGEIIVRVDGHTIITSDYVRQCVRLLQQTGAANVGGGMNPIGTTPMGRAIAAAGKSAFGVPTTFHIGNQAAFTDTVYLGAWPRTVFEQVGVFNTAVGVNEDYELNIRIRNNGGQIYFSPVIRSDYYGRQTIRQLARQYYRYGRSKVKTLRLYPASLRLRQIIAPLFVAGLVVGVFLGFVHPVFWGLWGAGIGLYALLNLVFAIRAAGDPAQIGRVMLVFPVMHSCWGLGFWRELIRPGAL